MGIPAGAFSYQYDAAGRMTGLTNPFGEASSWQSLDNGWLWTQGGGDDASPRVSGFVHKPRLFPPHVSPL